MKKNLLFCGLIGLLIFGNIHSQISNLGEPLSYSSKLQISDQPVLMPKVYNSELKSFYAQKALQTGEKILQYGFVHEVSINFFEQAFKQTILNKKNVYQLRIKSSDAVSINIIFNQFKLEEGTVMYVLSSDKKSFIGAYTSLNNNAANVLGTDLVYSDDIIIEIQEPIENENKSFLEIGRVIHGFIHLDETYEKQLNESGDCNIDVNCPQGSAWDIQRNAVVMLVNGSGGFCTGAMVNNTSGTEIPYLLTANHCGSDPANWIFRFRWESPEGQADCGTNAPSVNGPENMNITGGVTRANYAPSDFHLIELNSLPDPAWNAYYAGWNRLDIPASSGVGIHHPSGDIKKIAVSSSIYESVTYTTANEDHWKVYWSDGVTEGGSSGSPIFDQNRRIVGQLHGGASGCSSDDQSDSYGKFSYSWEGGGTAASRLKDWLDPSNSGVNVLDANMNHVVDAFVGEILGIGQTVCSSSVDPKFILSNGGSDTLISATITYEVDGVPTIINWNGNLGLFETDTISIPTLNLNSGQHTLIITVSDPNNSTDEVLSNNTISNTFNTFVNVQTLDLNLNFDCYANETSWEILTENDVLLYSGDDYSNNNQTPYTINEEFCLSNACYKIKLYDSYGDGMSYDGCGTNGSFTITNSLGTIVAELLESDADFGNEITIPFCITTLITSLENDSTLCYIGDEITLNSSTLSGNQWYFNGSPILNADSSSLIVNAPGTYYVVVNNESSNIVTIYQFSTPSTPSISTNDSTTFCEGGSATLSSSSTTQNIWSTGDTSNQIVVTTSGQYALVVDNNHCYSDTAYLQITVNPLPNVSITYTADTICIGSSVELTANGAVNYTWSNGVMTPTQTLTPNSSNLYTLTGVDLNGCTNSDEIYIEVFSDIDVEIIASDTNICIGEQVFLSATGGLTYVWNNGLNTNANQVVSPTEDSTYTYIVTSAFGNCEDSDTISVVANYCWGLDENEISMKIYPNPFNNELTIETQEMIEEVNIIDITGKIIYCDKTNTENTKQIYLNATSGIYTIIVKTKKENLIKKLIKS